VQLVHGHIFVQFFYLENGKKKKEKRKIETKLYLYIINNFVRQRKSGKEMIRTDTHLPLSHVAVSSGGPVSGGSGAVSSGGPVSGGSGAVSSGGPVSGGSGAVSSGGPVSGGSGAVSCMLSEFPCEVEWLILEYVSDIVKKRNGRFVMQLNKKTDVRFAMLVRNWDIKCIKYYWFHRLSERRER
jgi:hypothetical protein